MEEKIVTAIIAASVSLVVSLFGALGTWRQLVAQREKLEREIDVRRSEKLYEIRLRVYPKFFEITRVLMGASDVDRYSTYKTVRNELKVWRGGEPMLVLSKVALEATYALEVALRANPENGATRQYSQEQIAKVWKLRQRARGALRRDIGLLFGDDKEADFVGVRSR